jgi:hypothetical protein
MPTYQYTVVFGDDQTPQGQTTKTYYGEFADDAAAATAAGNLDTDIDAVTDMAVLRTIGPALITEVGGTPASGARATDALSASIFLNSAGKRGNHTVPAPVSAIMSGNTLDTSATAWTDYLDNFTAASGWELSDGEHARGATSSDTAGGKRVVVRANRRLPT